jgi:sulfonate transport system ATP-binding protein
LQAETLQEEVVAAERFRLSAGESAHAIAVSGLFKSYGTRDVLVDLDLTVPNGEFLAIVGRSGCGKSTLLRLIAGLDTPSSGRIEIEGRPLAGLNKNARVMFQDARLMPWLRVIDNVGLGLGKNAKVKADGALAEVGLKDRAGEWPAVLSGGQRQRIALARALAAEPQILLLDEPLGALDALTRLDMQRLISRLWLKRRCAVLLITHDVEEALSLADRVVMIEDGAITADERVDLPRPRDRSLPAFVAQKERLIDRLVEAGQIS